MTDTALARVEKSARPPTNFGQFLEVVKPRLQEVLPHHINAETLIRVVQAHGNTNTKLLKCTESSLLTSLMLCSQLGLPPNTPQGFAWLIPFWNGRQKLMECKVMFGKNGLAQLVRNSGEILRMNSGIVYEHEVRSGAFVHTNEPPMITHRSDVLAAPELYADEHLVAAYAVIETKEGGRVQRVLRRDEVLKRRDASQAVQKAKENGYNTPWDDWEGPMWVKTAIRALCGMPEVPKSTDLLTALASDVDAPAFDELQNITITQADAFRQQATLPPVVVAPALPTEEADAAPEPADTKEKGKPQDTGASKPKLATKAQTARLWGRWAKITDCDSKKPAKVDLDSFQGFVAHRIGEDKAKDSKLWTAEDVEIIGKGLDDLRDGKGAGPPADQADPPAASDQAAAPAEETAPEPEAAAGVSKADAMKQMKDLRKSLDMPWDKVRDIAKGCGVAAGASSKWSAAELLNVAEAMKASAAAATAFAEPEPEPEPSTDDAPPEPAPGSDEQDQPATEDPQPPARPADPDPEPGSDEEEPPPLEEPPAPESARKSETDSGE